MQISMQKAVSRMQKQKIIFISYTPAFCFVPTAF